MSLRNEQTKYRIRGYLLRKLWQLPWVIGTLCAGGTLAGALVTAMLCDTVGFSWLMGLGVALAIFVLFFGGWWTGKKVSHPLKKLSQEFYDVQAWEQLEEETNSFGISECQELWNAWRDARKQILRIFASQRDFIANAAHELKTPLATLRIIGETALRARNNEASLRDMMGGMLEETQRVTQVVEKLLMLARAESGRLTVEADYHKAIDIIGGIVEMLEPLAAKKNQILLPSIPQDLTLWTDANLLRLVIENLLSNAIQYSPEGAPIVLRAATVQPGIVAIEVIDEGPSICQEEENRLFERFFRSKNVRAKGSGLGLPIARWAAEAFGGRVEFERRMEVGSVFRVLCPETEWDHVPAAGDVERTEETSWREVDVSWATRVQPAQLLARLSTSRAGLLSEEAEKRRDAIGSNLLNASSRLPQHFWHSLRTPFNGILATSATLSFLLGHLQSAIVILVMILLSTGLRFFQEWRSSRAAESLHRMVSTEADVLRPGVSGKLSLPVEDLVPGDVLHLSAGDMVPADVRLLSASHLKISEATFTGDSFPVPKEARSVEEDLTSNFCYMGTHVVTGSGIGVVVATGASTRLGGISKRLRQNRPKNAFERNVEQVGWMLMGFIAVIGPLVFLVNGALKNDWPGALLFSLAVIVGLTPEFLPVIVNVNLARGALASARQGLVIKELSAMHSLGAINVLCSDKTGTLTLDTPRFIRAIAPLNDERSHEVLTAARLNAVFQGSLRSKLDQELLQENHIRQGQEAKAFQLLGEIPFDHERRRVSVVLREKKSGEILLLCKGAPETVLAACSSYCLGQKEHPLQEQERVMIQRQFLAMQQGGTQMLGVARRKLIAATDQMSPQQEADMSFLGFVLFQDPLNTGFCQTADRLREAGIATKILTGGHPDSAVEGLREAGVATSGLLLGEQIDAMTDDALRAVAPQTTVFARLGSSQKARIVRVLRSVGYCVGFLGHGANDANALREADVGIASSTSADLARECAQVILLDKNPEMLLAGINEGRAVTGNILKYIKCTFSSNFGNVFTILAAGVVLPFLPMQAIQLLVQNLLYDVTQIFLPWDSVDESFRAKPRQWLPHSIAGFMVLFGPLSSIFDLITFCVLWFIYGANCPERAAFFQTGWFIVGLSTQLLVVHVLRTEKIPFFQSWAAPPLLIATLLVLCVSLVLPSTPFGALLGFVYLPKSYYIWVAGIVMLYLLAAQVAKSLYHRFYRD